MSCTRELPPLQQDHVLTSQEETLLWEREWNAITGVAKVSLTADVRNLVLGSGAAVALKPAIQMATVRVDRPDPGAAISAGSVITAEGVSHFEETLSGSNKFYFRRGFSLRLTAGSYARVETTLHTAFRACGTIFPAREIPFHPMNSTAAVHYFSLTGRFPLVGVDKAKLAVIGMDNLNTSLQWRAAGRTFIDPTYRGAWVDLMSGWQTPATGDFGVNTGEIDLSGLSLASNHWGELALAVRKDADGSAPSRCIFHVIPAIKYN
jgi:hypothetical protein